MSSQISKAFTLCVDGRPTLTFSAQRFGEARELCKETWLREDLCSLRSNGKPLCDAQSKLTVRVASQEEGGEYEKGIDPTRPSSDLMLIYLVEIDGIGDGLI
jgi:hypothetical protein